MFQFLRQFLFPPKKHPHGAGASMGLGKEISQNIQLIKNGFKGFHTNWALNTHKTYFVNKTMSKLEKNRQNYIQESKSIYFIKM